MGTIEAKPGAINVIAGEARLTLDIRHGLDGIRTQAVDNLIRQAEEIAKRRGLSVSRKTGCEPHHMVSGAGHDAMILAEKVPAAMIFLRTRGGISHDPAESVARDDVAKAIECGLHLLDQLASSSTLQKRTCRA